MGFEGKDQEAHDIRIQAMFQRRRANSHQKWPSTSLLWLFPLLGSALIVITVLLMFRVGMVRVMDMLRSW